VIEWLVIIRESVLRSMYDNSSNPQLYPSNKSTKKWKKNTILTCNTVMMVIDDYGIDDDYTHTVIIIILMVIMIICTYNTLTLGICTHFPLCFKLKCYFFSLLLSILFYSLFLFSLCISLSLSLIETPNIKCDNEFFSYVT